MAAVRVSCQENEVGMTRLNRWNLNVCFAKKVSTFVLKRQNSISGVVKCLDPTKEYVTCRLGIHSTGKPERGKRLSVIGVDGGDTVKKLLKEIRERIWIDLIRLYKWHRNFSLCKGRGIL